MLTLFARKQKPRLSDFSVNSALLSKFKSLSISRSSKRIIPAYSNPLMFSRQFHSSVPTLDERTHLDVLGHIKHELIHERIEFLQEHNLLEDKIDYEGRSIYCNKHLFSLNAKDRSGRTNAHRMAKGLCSVTDDFDLVIIHHLDQSHHGDWVVLTNHFHQTYDRQLHSKTTVRNPVNRGTFQQEKKRYWKQQASQRTLEEASDVKSSSTKFKPH